MASKLDREPVAAAAGLNVVLQALMNVLIAFNVPITPIQAGAVTTLVVVFSAWWVRGKVFAPVDASGQPITAVTQDQFSTIAAQTNTPPPPEIMRVHSEMPHQIPITAEEAMKEIDEYAESLKKKP